MTSSGWQKSSHSAANNDCVEVRAVDGLIELRESDEGGVVIRTTPREFARLLRAAKSGEFDHHAKLTP